MRHFASLRSLAVLALIALSLWAGSARAQTDEERTRARTEFERGVAAYGTEDFQTALDAFQEAYRLAPHPSVRLNIAHCYEGLDRPVEALFHFEHYLTEATSIAPPQRREIEGTIRGLRRRVGTITLQVTPDGATIVIDGTETRRAPVSEPVRVVAGDHTVAISLDGYAAESQTVHVDGGADARVAVRLRRAEVVATVVTPPVETVVTPTEPVEADVVVAETPVEETPAEEPSSGGGIRFTAPFFIAGGITLAAAAGWGVTGGIALAENDAFEADVVRANDPALSEMAQADARASGLGHADTARTLAITSDVLLVTTLVGLGATTFFFILAQTEPTDDAESPTVMVLPLVAPALAGNGLGGSGIGTLGLTAGGTF